MLSDYIKKAHSNTTAYRTKGRGFESRLEVSSGSSVGRALVQHPLLSGPDRDTKTIKTPSFSPP